MADDDIRALPDPATRTKSNGGVHLILTVLLLTALAVGLGGGFGVLMVSNIEAMVLAKHVAESEAKKTSGSPYSGDISLKAVAPVVTNLASSENDWIRLEASIVFKSSIQVNPDLMAAETRQDLLAYLRTVSIAQIQGPSGLLHLRDDLNERVRLRSKGNIQELIVESLVIQ
jgi:flagellar protein FliL